MSKFNWLVSNAYQIHTDDWYVHNLARDTFNLYPAVATLVCDYSYHLLSAGYSVHALKH